MKHSISCSLDSHLCTSRPTVRICTIAFELSCITFSSSPFGRLGDTTDRAGYLPDRSRVSKYKVAASVHRESFTIRLVQSVPGCSPAPWLPESMGYVNRLECPPGPTEGKHGYALTWITYECGDSSVKDSKTSRTRVQGRRCCRIRLEEALAKFRE